MARTTQQIIEDMLGKQTMQIAALTAALEDSQEKSDALQKALELEKNPPIPLKALKANDPYPERKESNG